MQASNGKSKILKIAIPVVLLVVVGTVVATLKGVGENKGYAPDQPIPFSHKLHAGQYNIPCMYCHVGVEKTRHAVVPSMNVCMNCHSVVKPDSPYIKKMKELYNEKNEAFNWVRVHDLPDHVYFSHKRHVTKGIACETCHGDVKKMAVVRQEGKLTMGWCLDCHRGKTAPTHIARATEDNKDGNGIPKGGVAPTSCYTCHH